MYITYDLVNQERVKYTTQRVAAIISFKFFFLFHLILIFLHQRIIHSFIHSHIAYHNIVCISSVDSLLRRTTRVSIFIHITCFYPHTYCGGINGRCTAHNRAKQGSSSTQQQMNSIWWYVMYAIVSMHRQWHCHRYPRTDRHLSLIRAEATDV